MYSKRQVLQMVVQFITSIEICLNQLFIPNNILHFKMHSKVSKNVFVGIV